jgi:hypothetical protein
MENDVLAQQHQRVPLGERILYLGPSTAEKRYRLSFNLLKKSQKSVILLTVLADFMRRR